MNRIAAVATLLVGCTHLCAQAETYVVFDPPNTRPGDFFNLRPDAINASGEVSGTFYNCTPNTSCTDSFGFIRASDGTYTVFPATGASRVVINAAGTTAGEDATARPFVRSREGVYTYFDVVTNPVITAINDRGDVLGIASSLNGDGTQTSFVRTSDGAITMTPPNFSLSAINDAGVAVGYRAAPFELPVGAIRAADGSVATFSVPPMPVSRALRSLGTYEQATAINNAGTVVGDAGETAIGLGAYAYPFQVNRRSFIRSADGSIVTFKPNEINERSRTARVSGINFAGTVTGEHFPTADAHARGFLRNAAGVFTDFKVPGMLQTSPTAINDSGVVTGNCLDAKANLHGFLRLP